MFEKPVEAVLFDMDGLLLDSEAVYIEALQVAARAGGREMPLDLCDATVGLAGDARYLRIQEHFGAGFDLAEFRVHFSAHVKRVMNERVPVKPGVVEMLDFLDARRLPRALATSARRATVDNHLGRFHHIVTREDVERLKPHPDIYLEAARRLGIAPERCVAFEDSNVGLTAAHAAGTMAIMVPDIRQPTPEVRAKCLAVLPDLHAALGLLRQAF